MPARLFPIHAGAKFHCAAKYLSILLDVEYFPMFRRNGSLQMDILDILPGGTTLSVQVDSIPLDHCRAQNLHFSPMLATDIYFFRSQTSRRSSSLPSPTLQITTTAPDFTSNGHIYFACGISAVFIRATLGDRPSLDRMSVLHVAFSGHTSNSICTPRLSKISTYHQKANGGLGGGAEGTARAYT
jgi:hypothetical protein